MKHLKNMKRVDAFWLGVLALLLVGISWAGIVFAPPSLFGPSVPTQYPIFVVSFCINYLPMTLVLIGLAIASLYQALREDE